MKIRYLLKKKGKSPYPIYVALYDGDETGLIFTGERSPIGDWSKTDREPKDQDGEVFQNIETVKKAILKVKRIMDANEEAVTPFTLKQEYEKGLSEKEEKQQQKDRKDKTNLTTISSLINKWIKKDEDGIYLHLDAYQDSTRRVVVTSIKMFQDFLKSTGRGGLERASLSMEIINEYAKHLQVKKKLKDSTHGKKMKHLRWFLKFINFDTGFIKDVKIRSIKPSERNIIHLTLDELRALEAVDVSYNKELQRSKDMYLLGCYTGLRVSDLKRISKHRIENGNISMTLKKNRTVVSIPLLAQTKEILERYDMGAPKISEQQVNDGIKIVCDKAGINKKIHKKSVKAGQLIETLHPKHDLITTHTAGKTFISLAGKLWDLSPVEIAAIVGKDVKTILGYYLKPDAVEAGRKMLEAEARSIMKIAN